MVEVQKTRPYRILVSDDDRLCREAVRDALEPAGYSTELASCGREAIQAVRRHMVHVIIVDMNMPDMTGVDTVTIIRREIATPLPSILMTGDPSRELMLKAMEAHFESFLTKPFEVGALRHIVEEIIRRHYEPS